jgi:hypothetical protein
VRLEFVTFRFFFWALSFESSSAIKGNQGQSRVRLEFVTFRFFFWALSFESSSASFASARFEGAGGPLGAGGGGGGGGGGLRNPRFITSSSIAWARSRCASSSSISAYLMRGAISSHQRQSRASKGNQGRTTHRASSAITGNHWQSISINVNQC